MNCKMMISPLIGRMIMRFPMVLHGGGKMVNNIIGFQFRVGVIK